MEHNLKGIKLYVCTNKVIPEEFLAKNPAILCASLIKWKNWTSGIFRTDRPKNHVQQINTV